MRVVAGTVGNDEHSVGIREILDIKHGGIEKFGFKYTYLGTSVPPEKFIDAAIETGAEAVLISTIITHNEVHVSNLTKISQLAIEKGVRDKLIFIRVEPRSQMIWPFPVEWMQDSDAEQKAFT